MLGKKGGKKAQKGGGVKHRIPKARPRPIVKPRGMALKSKIREMKFGYGVGPTGAIVVNFPWYDRKAKKIGILKRDWRELSQVQKDFYLTKMAELFDPVLLDKLTKEKAEMQLYSKNILNSRLLRRAGYAEVKGALGLRRSDGSLRKMGYGEAVFSLSDPKKRESARHRLLYFEELLLNGTMKDLVHLVKSVETYGRLPPMQQSLPFK